MAEAITARIEPGTESNFTVDELRFRPRVVPLAAVRPRVAIADLKLRQSLAAFDRARSWDELRAAQQRVLALDHEVIASVLAELLEPQPPNRADVLLALLVRWTPPGELIELARSDEAGPVLRSALAEALGRCVETADRSDRERISSTLTVLIRDADARVRVAAAEAIGLAGLASAPEVRGVLRNLAVEDSNEDVQAEARAILEEND
jgi:hypothetical protein